jgi:DNA-binding CsgD family transcriptional regulator
MTSIGFVIMDYFSQCVEYSSDKRRQMITDRDITILRQLYSLEDGYFATNEEIGRRLGLTSERVRQIQRRALIKVKTVSEKNRLLISKINKIITSYAIKTKRKISIKQLFVSGQMKCSIYLVTTL